MTRTFYDFFCGGGMAGLGLGPDWQCVFANEIDPIKGEVYRANHSGGSELQLKDVGLLSVADIPEAADLSWASFPCQDLSLAGQRNGLNGQRSGTFHDFWRLMRGLAESGRAPKIISLENVCGLLTSNGGKDFLELADCFSKLGYSFGAIVINAVRFLPQSRPRLFVVGVRQDLPIPKSCISSGATNAWHTPALRQLVERFSGAQAKNWIWWDPPEPETRSLSLHEIVGHQEAGVEWHSAAETSRLLDMMTLINIEKIEAAKASGQRSVGTLYRRTRPDLNGIKRQRAEVRFDGVAGCLRTPGGGSSRQTIVVVEDGKVRTRLLTPREAAALMGLPKTYSLPPRYNDAYKLAGDGVAVPVVTHLSKHVFMPVLAEHRLALAA